MSALYFFFLWQLEVFLGGLILASFTRLIPTQWLNPFQPCERVLKWMFALVLILFLLNIGHFPILTGAGPRAFYFSRAFFFARAAFYFLCWAAILIRQHYNQARGGSWMLILTFASGSLASFDWLMALSKDFDSTIFGFIFLISALLLSYALLLFYRVKDEHLIDLNNVHLALIGTWTYLSVAQLMTIWSGNLPREAHYYLIRTREGWAAFPLMLAVVQFAIPLFLLLFRDLKIKPAFTRGLAVVSILMQTAFLYWCVMPEWHPTRVANGAEIALLFALILAIIGIRFYAHD